MKQVRRALYCIDGDNMGSSCKVSFKVMTQMFVVLSVPLIVTILLLVIEAEDHQENKYM